MNDASIDRKCALPAFFAMLACLLSSVARADDKSSVAAYETIQAALDANRGRMVFVPAGDYKISEKLRVRGEGSGLFGPGRIVQTQSDQPVLEIEDAYDAEIRDLTLTRSEGSRDTDKEGILAIHCRDLVIENVRVIDNRTRSGAIIAGGVNTPRGLRFSNNLFHPGTAGIANTELAP